MDKPNHRGPGGQDEQLGTPEPGPSQLEKIRRDKLNAIRQRGLEPFGSRYARTHHARQIVSEYPDNDGQTVQIAGRLMAQRVHGKASFADIHDLSGRLQVYGRVDSLGEQGYADFLDLDLGDIVGVRGQVFKSRRGEISLAADEITLLAKSLRPLPEKWHGLRDVDLRYRQRYVDLIVNP